MCYTYGAQVYLVRHGKEPGRVQDGDLAACRALHTMPQ